MASQYLSHLVRVLDQAGVENPADYKDWSKRKGSVEVLAEHFAYPSNAGLPPIMSVVKPFFHPDPKLRLIGWNYTPVAHNVLHDKPEGWTDPLRLARGVVYERGSGQLIALPMPKFFNDGEHPETKHLAGRAFTATVKHDGHLSINFNYQGQWLTTTRGSFTSPTAVIAQRALDAHLADPARRRGWDEYMGVTILAEFIHPDTKVIVEYGGLEEFILLTAYDRTKCEELAYDFLRHFVAKALDVPITETWSGHDIAELRAYMKNRGIKNQEGFVARFDDGLRAKFKFATYIGEMVARKLSYAYVMRRLIAGNSTRMFGTLEEELLDEAHKMMRRVKAAAKTGTRKERRDRLYALVDEAGRTAGFKNAVCDYLNHLGVH